MDEGGAFAGAQAALRDGLRFDEGAKFIVGGVGGDRFVVAEELPLREILQLQLGFELREVRECGTLRQQAAGDELRAGFLHADLERSIGFGIERHGFAIDDVVLPHPASMRLADLDLDARVILSPSPNKMFDFAESFDVVIVRTVLADFESAVRFDERRRKFGMAIEEESVSDEHQIGSGPRFTSQLQVLDHVRI